MTTTNPPDDSSASTGKSGKPPRKKYKHTRQLVQMALDDGMTQKEIADACRVQQSVVSKWKNGESRGTEEQLAKLIKKYGHRLNRTTSRVYRVMAAPDARWETTELGRQIVALCEQADRLDKRSDQRRAEQFDKELRRLWRVTFPQYEDIWNWRYPLNMIIDHHQIEFASIFPTRVAQVEGPILFRYSFCRFEPRADRRGIDVPRMPVSRWTVHDGQLGRLILVRQYRAALTAQKHERWKEEIDDVSQSIAALAEQVKAKAGTVPPMIPSFWVDSADDAAKWICRIEAPMTVEELLAFADQYVGDPLQIHSPHDELALPFLLRKALIEHGHQVPGLEKISGCE